MDRGSSLESRGVVRPPIVHTYKRNGRKVNAQEINDEGMMQQKIVPSGAHGVGKRGRAINMPLLG